MYVPERPKAPSISHGHGLNGRDTPATGIISGPGRILIMVSRGATRPDAGLGMEYFIPPPSRIKKVVRGLYCYQLYVTVGWIV